MRFKDIKIENLFSYYGERHFRFDEEGRPVTLIIGENGFGKTSFINSVKIALHGVNRDILSIGSQSLTKDDFVMGNADKNFSGVLNRKAREAGGKVAKVEIVLEDNGDILKIERKFTLNKKGYSETLKAFDGEENLLAEGDEAQDMINKHVSPTMARFFFFDGEKIQTIADFSHEEFTKMLEDVLELDIYDQMQKDAEFLIRKISKGELDEDMQKEVDEKEALLEKQKEHIESTKVALKGEEKVLKRLKAEKEATDKRIDNLKSRFKKPLSEAKDTLSKLNAEKDMLVGELKKATLVELPLLLNRKLKKKVKEDIEKNYKGKTQIDPALLVKKKEELLQMLGEGKESVSKAFDKVFAADTGKKSVSFADPHKVEKQYDLLPNTDLLTLLGKLSENKYRMEETMSEIAALEQSIQSDKKEYEEDFALAERLTKDIIRQEMKLEQMEKDLVLLIEEEKETEREIARLTIREHKSAVANAKIRTLESIIAVSEKMKKKIKSDKRAALEQSINEKFKKLKKEGYEADRIVLDENFNINLFDKHRRPMDILSSSSGQKQIIATALIWGISDYISDDIPMIIDTPLGRLDERNQSLILNEFYPNVSKQVIILPTPSELKHEGFVPLTEHISQTFVLKNAGSATSVEKADIRDIVSGNGQKKKQLEMEF